MVAPYSQGEMQMTFVKTYWPEYVQRQAKYLNLCDVSLVEKVPTIIVQAHEPPPRTVPWDRNSVPALINALGGTHKDIISTDGQAIRFSIWYDAVRKNGSDYVARIGQACAILAQDSINRACFVSLIGGFTSTVANGAGSTVAFFSNGGHLRKDGTGQINLATDVLNPKTLDAGWRKGAKWTDWNNNDLYLGDYGSVLCVDTDKLSIAQLCVGKTIAASLVPFEGSESVTMQQVENPLANRGITVMNHNFEALGGDVDDWFLVFQGATAQSRCLKAWIQVEPVVIVEPKDTEQRYEVLLMHEAQVALTAPSTGTIIGSNVAD